MTGRRRGLTASMTMCAQQRSNHTAVGDAAQKLALLRPRRTELNCVGQASGRLTYDQLLRALVKSVPWLTREGADNVIRQLELLEAPVDETAECIELPAFLAIRQMLVDACLVERNAT